MKTYLKGLSLIFLLLFVSCDDILNTSPVSELTPEISFENGEDAEAGIFGVYNRLLNALGGGNRFFVYGEIRGDGVTFDGTALETIDESKLQPTMSQADWGPFYAVINGANQIIDVVPGITEGITEVKRSQIIAEAHFLRALSYFWLVRIWGDVPLPTKAYTSVAQELQLSRSPISAVFDVIEEDIDIAIRDLPESYSTNTETRGRATVGAAHALNTHVSLWIAQRENGGEEYFNRVIESANYIINSPEYELVDSFAEIFSEEDTPEYIFAMIYDNSYQQTNSIASYFFVEPYSSSLRAGVQFDQIVHDHVAAYPEDERTDVYYREKRPEDLVQHPFLVKFPGKTFDSEGYSNSDSNIPLFRYSDILLLKAEALNETGNTAGAVSLVNEIRERAGLAAISAASKAEATDIILHERLIELVGEGHYFFDLVRNGKAIELSEILSEEQILWPIHVEELTQNPNLDQNSYY
ncbi:RagB/SusD family nutrient uptake outer membrane protein [Rhodohalobacter sp. 614A]|uniref:RagB/SusD family nutrient uptake outer membrane protein n=1 Tax=Rhodohalobacter sp. 614A TaxID=2908649 RepID=UPI001F46BBAA|nr:RagB/SusD family nutrient uptake outer membrane protein [Rhodohalobacter sp. 614A]